MNSMAISAAGKATPSSSKSPSSTTAPSFTGTCATMRLPRFACQMRTTATPSRGAVTSPSEIAKGPTAVVRLPQFPDQSMTGLSIATWPKR